MGAQVLLIACGALAREIVWLTRQNGWQHLKIQCLPAELHNRPQKIPGAVAEVIEANRDKFEHIFVAYADCGTGGLLDKMLANYGIERLPGAHCYEFFTGATQFAEFCDAEPGTFFLTDFLVRHFDRLVRKGLGLDRHPELKDQYFQNYQRVMFIAQAPTEDLRALAKAHAAYLGLEYAEHCTGFEPFNNALKEHVVRWQN
jgi:hypothetical protein